MLQVPLRRQLTEAELGVLSGAFPEPEVPRTGSASRFAEPVSQNPGRKVPAVSQNPVTTCLSAKPSEEGGTLRISARVQQGTLALQLSDTGPGLGNGNNGQKSSGVGLRNTRERLQHLYGDAQAVTLAPNEPSGLTVTINIPFELNDA